MTPSSKSWPFHIATTTRIYIVFGPATTPQFKFCVPNEVSSTLNENHIERKDSGSCSKNDAI